MISREEVLSWLLEYSCRYQHYDIVSEIIKSNNGLLKCSHLCVSCAMLQRIVYKAEVSRYPVAIKHLDYIYKSCGKALPFMIYAKLVTGLKEKVLLNTLKENEEDVWSELTFYFPENGSHYDGVNKTMLAKVHTAEKDFRRFILDLYFDSDGRLSYFEEEYEEEYGTNFQTALQKLVTMVTDRLYGYLPPCVIDKILANGLEKYKPLTESCRTFKILIDGLCNGSNCLGTEASEMRPDEGVLQDILRKLTQPASDMEWQSHLSESQSRRNSSSLFSSESSKEKNSANMNDSDLKSSESCVKMGKPCSSGIRPCSPVKHTVSAVKTFTDFNNKRHLFHTLTTCSDEGKCSNEKKDNSCRNSEEIIISSDKSVKSSSESVSLLKVRTTKRRECPSYSDNENNWHESQGSRGSDNVEASDAINTEDLVDVLRPLQNSTAHVEDTTLHTEQSDVESESQHGTEEDIMFTSIISNTNRSPKSHLPHSSLTILGDSSQEVINHAVVHRKKSSSQAAKKNSLNETRSNHRKDNKQSKGKVSNQTSFHKQIDLSAGQHSSVESSSDDDLVLETNETIFAFLDHENLEVASNGSISDINDIDSDEEIIPPSCADELEFWDVFSTEDDTHDDQFPFVFTHRHYSNIKLCIVKLHRNKALDVNSGVGMLYQMYS